MTELTHWHKPGAAPGVRSGPPACCEIAAQGAADKAVADVEREAAAELAAERHRIVTEAVGRIAAYADAAGSLLEDESRKRLVARVAQRCVEAVRQAACTCPVLEVQRWEEARPDQVRGLDPSCGVHGTAATT